MMNAFISRLTITALLLTVAAPGRSQNSPDGVIKVTTTVHGDGSYTNMEINPDTKKAEGTTYNQAKKLMQRVVYTLNELNEPVEGVIYNAAGKVMMKAKYVRDPANRISEEVDYDPAGRVFRRLTYEYDGHGKVRRINAFDGAGNPIQVPGAKGGGKPAKKKRGR